MRPLALLKDGWRNWEWEFGGLGGLASCQEFIRGAASASVKEEGSGQRQMEGPEHIRAGLITPAGIRAKNKEAPSKSERLPRGRRPSETLGWPRTHTPLYIFLQPSNKINTECNAINIEAESNFKSVLNTIKPLLGRPQLKFTPLHKYVIPLARTRRSVQVSSPLSRRSRELLADTHPNVDAAQTFSVGINWRSVLCVCLPKSFRC
jgi:hypothetical protein